MHTKQGDNATKLQEGIASERERKDFKKNREANNSINFGVFICRR